MGAQPARVAELTESELFSFLRARLAPHKTPKHWVFVEQFPTTASGKIQKFVLRDQFTAGARPTPARSWWITAPGWSAGQVASTPASPGGQRASRART